MTYKRILVPVDGSATATAGLREAIRMAKAQDATLQLVHVVDQHSVVMMGMETAVYMDEMIKGLEASGRRILARAQALAEKAGVKATTVLRETLTGPAADPIVDQAKKGRADLIVIGTHGRRGVRRLVMGSDAEQVVRTSPVPVLLVRAGGQRAKMPR
jgi:nucleotide-binding universal stress UspA family protein